MAKSDIKELPQRTQISNENAKRTETSRKGELLHIFLHIFYAHKTSTQNLKIFKINFENKKSENFKLLKLNK